MLLKSLSLAALLLGAAPVLAGPAAGAGPASASQVSSTSPAASKPAPAASKPAPAASRPQGAQGGTCSACGAPGGDGTCSAPVPGQAEEISDEEWKEFIRKKIAESEEVKPEPVDPDPFSFSVYRGQRPEPMGSQTIINGGKMDIATLIVPDPPHVVEEAYFTAIQRMGFRPMVGDVPRARGLRYVSFRPAGSRKLKTVTLVPSNSGTVILASVGNPEDLLVKKPELPGGLPVPPRAQAASSIQQTEPGSTSQSSFFLVRESTPEQVRDFYRRELAQRGYALVPDSSQMNVESFEKGGAMLSISAKAATEPNTVAVSLSWLQ